MRKHRQAVTSNYDSNAIRVANLVNAELRLKELEKLLGSLFALQRICTNKSGNLTELGQNIVESGYRGGMSIVQISILLGVSKQAVWLRVDGLSKGKGEMADKNLDNEDSDITEYIIIIRKSCIIFREAVEHSTVLTELRNLMRNSNKKRLNNIGKMMLKCAVESGLRSKVISVAFGVSPSYIALFKSREIMSHETPRQSRNGSANGP